MVNIAQAGALVLLSLFLALHLVILFKCIPYNLVWGGRLKSDRDMYRFEILSIIINAIFLVVILIRSNTLGADIPRSIITFSLWFMTGIFLLNTVGNIYSKNKMEKKLFAPITILLATFSLILALSN